MKAAESLSEIMKSGEACACSKNILPLIKQGLAFFGYEYKILNNTSIFGVILFSIKASGKSEDKQ